MSQFVFGTGQLFATPVGGGAPLRFGALQDVSVDFSGDVKQLFGQYQFALDTARGKTKIEWKASTGNIDVEAFNQIFFGETVDTGNQLIQVINENGGAIPATPFQITATHGADFVMDLGVYDAADASPFKQVAATPGPGEYTVSGAGVYTFNTADTGKVALLNYLWEDSATGGSLDIGNQLMGNTPKFQLVLSQNYDGKYFTLLLYSNVADKLSLPLKMDDYLLAELSGQSMADAANRVARITTTSIAGGGN
jgi:hypothetical protein